MNLQPLYLQSSSQLLQPLSCMLTCWLSWECLFCSSDLHAARRTAGPTKVFTAEPALKKCVYVYVCVCVCVCVCTHLPTVMMMVSDDCLVDCQIDDDKEEEMIEVPPPPEFASTPPTPSPVSFSPTSPVSSPPTPPITSPLKNRDPHGINQHLQVLSPQQ